MTSIVEPLARLRTNRNSWEAAAFHSRPLVAVAFIDYDDYDAAAAARSMAKMKPCAWSGGRNEPNPFLTIFQNAKRWGATLLLTSLLATGIAWAWAPNAASGVATDTRSSPATQSQPASTASSAAGQEAQGRYFSCEMALFAREMAAMARTLSLDKDAARFDDEAGALSSIINRLLWDPATRFYYDQTADGQRTRTKTIAAYWALLAGVAGPDQADALASELNNPATFGRPHRVPTLAADQPGYNPQGGYWRGAVWAPTTTMVIRGLEKYGRHELARAIALQDLNAIWQVFRNTGSIWENYAPDAMAPGKPAQKDFVGWSGIGPILYLLEYGIGLKADAMRNELNWHLRSAGRVGCARYRFNGHVADLLAEPIDHNHARRITIRSDGAFTLKVKTGKREQTFSITKGNASLRLEVE